MKVFGDPATENVAPEPQFLTVSVPVELVGSHFSSQPRSEKMSLRDAHSASVRTPD